MGASRCFTSIDGRHERAASGVSGALAIEHGNRDGLVACLFHEVAHFSNEDLRIKRLGDDIVLKLRIFVADDEDDWHLGQSRLELECLADFQSAHLRHVHIQQYQVGDGLAGELQRLAAGICKSNWRKLMHDAVQYSYCRQMHFNVVLQLRMNRRKSRN
jgi:hypothetical protein